MRVPNTDHTVNRAMVKRKQKWKKTSKKKENQTDSSDEGLNTAVNSSTKCQHVSKSINLAAVRRSLNKQTVGECIECQKLRDYNRSSQSHNSIFTENSEGCCSENVPPSDGSDVWLCLQCGHQGCGRYSEQSHALKHFATPHSSLHSVVVHLSTYNVWCYSCDDSITSEKYKRVQECVNFVQRLQPVAVEKSKDSDSPNDCLATESNLKTLDINDPKIHCPKVKGLSNLGNTCFFNAILQNLSRTPQLQGFFCESSQKGYRLQLQGRSITTETAGNRYDPDTFEILKNLPSIEVTLQESGILTNSFVSFLKDINSVSKSGMVNPNHSRDVNSFGKSGVVNPAQLFNQICKIAPRFKGFQQQDSHELLRYLLDNIKTEEIKRAQSGILHYFHLPDNVNAKKVDEDTRTKIKEYGREAKQTLVDKIFGGVLLSTVICDNCHQLFTMFESFLDLSLPVCEEKPTLNHVMNKKQSNSGSSQVDDNKRKLSKREQRQAKKQVRRESKNRPEDVGNIDKVQTESITTDKREVEYESDADAEDNVESDVKHSDHIKPNSTTVPSSRDDSGSHKESCSTSNQNLSSLPSSDSHVLTVEDTNNTIGLISDCVDTLELSSSENRLILGSCLLANNGGLVSGEDINRDAPQSPDTLSNRIENLSVKDGGDSYVINMSNITGSVSNINDSNSFQNLGLPGNDKDNTSKSTELDIDRRFNSVVRSRYLNEKGPHIPPLRKSSSLEAVGRRGFLHSDNDVDKPLMQSFSDDNNVGRSCHLSQLLSCNSNRLSGPAEGQSQNYICVNDPKGRSSNSTSVNSSVTAPVDLTRILPASKTENAVNGDNSKCARTVLCGSSSPSLSREHYGKTTSGEVSGILMDRDEDESKCHKNNVNRRRNRLLSEQTQDVKRGMFQTLASRYSPKAHECSVLSCLNQFTSAELLTGSNKFGCEKCARLQNGHSSAGSDDDSHVHYSNASKHYLIFIPPAVLTLHFKRFEQERFRTRKINRHVQFDFHLDLSSFCSSLSPILEKGQERVLYSLYGVIEHSGQLSSGHYTAYVKVQPGRNQSNLFFNEYPIHILEEDFISNLLNIDNNCKGVNHDASNVDKAKEETPCRWFYISDSNVSEVTEAVVRKAQAYMLFYERIL